MAVTLTITTIPIGSILTSAISGSDPEGKNDFRVRIITSENGSGLEESDITFSTGASLVELTGANAVWEATIRPPETAGTLTITIGADAFTEGNVETSFDIRISTSFPDADAETATQLFTLSSFFDGIAITPTRILLNGSSLASDVFSYTHEGVEQPSEQLDSGTSTGDRRINYFNNTLLFASGTPFNTQRRSLPDLDEIAEYIGLNNGSSLMQTRLGIATPRIGTTSKQFYIQPYGTTDASDVIIIDVSSTFPSGGSSSFSNVAHQNDLFYLVSGHTANHYALAEINSNDDINFLAYLNINRNTIVQDTAFYRDTLYLLTANPNAVHTIDIRKYRPIAKNTKTSIYPVFANEGETIPLKQYCPDAHTLTFATGFDKPTYLSINADNELEIASNAVTETQPVLVRLTGINYIDSVDFSFYLIIVQATNPTVRDVTDLAMYASTTFDLFDVVGNATAITFRTGQTQPTGSSISNGVFTIGTVGGTAYFTATNSNGSTNFEIAIDVVSVDADNFSDTFRYRTEIAGIDVSTDVKGTPTVSESIDAVRLNVNTANRVNLTLRSDSTNGFKFNGGIADNFWDANSLNADGFQEPIKVYIESLISGSYVRSLLFSGMIHEPAASISEAEVRISAIDLSGRLRNALVSDFGTLIKWDGLKQQSDEVNYEGVNVPESSLLPIQLGTGTAWADRTKLDISRLPLPSEGPAQSNTGYLTSQDFRTAGGFLASLPILRFKTEHRAEDVRFLFKQLGINKNIYQTQIDIPAIERDTPFILNRGSVPFSIEDTRITRLPTDWVHDSTNDRVLILLSNPESHIADLLVQYDLGSDAYRILHTFHKDIKTHRITRRNANNYYILTSAPITQDRSAETTLPRQSDKTASAFDSAAVGSDVKIYAYNTSTGVLTAHVEETDTYPPQLGIHYHVGFENVLYIDEFEGIVADYRGAFPVQSGDLYYRYAKDGEFGIASVDTSGATTELISQSTLNYHNHLNFAFDLTTTGTLYFVYAEGNSGASTLTIKRRTSAGVETTIFTDTQSHNPLTNDNGGAYLGCHEAVFHNDLLYMLCPIQHVTPINRPLIRYATTNQDPGDRFVTSVIRDFSTADLSPGDTFSIRVNWDSNISGDDPNSPIIVTGGTITNTSVPSASSRRYAIQTDAGNDLSNIVFVIPKDRVSEGNGRVQIDISFYDRVNTKAAGMALFSCDVTAGSPSLTVIERWDFVTHSAANLTIHDGAVHYTEQPIAASKFLPINSDL